MEKPGTPSSEQSDKSKKYDRQLRFVAYILIYFAYVA